MNTDESQEQNKCDPRDGERVPIIRVDPRESVAMKFDSIVMKPCF